MMDGVRRFVIQPYRGQLEESFEPVEILFRVLKLNNNFKVLECAPWPVTPQSKRAKKAPQRFIIILRRITHQGG